MKKGEAPSSPPPPYLQLIHYKKQQQLLQNQEEFPVPLCNVTKCLKETVVDRTWVQSTIATRYDYFVMDNMVYKGVVNSKYT